MNFGKTSRMKLKLSNLKLQKLSPNQLLVDNNNPSEIEDNNIIWIIVNICSFVLCFIILALQIIKKVQAGLFRISSLPSSIELQTPGLNPGTPSSIPRTPGTNPETPSSNLDNDRIYPNVSLPGGAQF
uniref:Uncharacterized protein n=1 Tax=Cacopsylla melanoneura TaxID=428564 RepID=A0A8D8RCN2_9HEMI